MVLTRTKKKSQTLSSKTERGVKKRGTGKGAVVRKKHMVINKNKKSGGITIPGEKSLIGGRRRGETGNHVRGVITLV